MAAVERKEIDKSSLKGKPIVWIMGELSQHLYREQVGPRLCEDKIINCTFLPAYINMHQFHPILHNLGPAVSSIPVPRSILIPSDGMESNPY